MNIYQYAPNYAIPDLGTKERQILDLLWNTSKVERQTLVSIDENFRQYLQGLGNEDFGYWNILRLKERGSRRFTHIALDSRHLEGREQDQIARAARRKELKVKSFQRAKGEVERLEKAIKEQAEALDYWNGLIKGEAPSL